MIYVKASSFWPSEQFWHNNPCRVRNRILCSLVAVPSNGSYFQITANMPSMCLVDHATEKFLRIFMFPSCGRHRQQGLKAVSTPCATTLLLGYAWKSIWIVVMLSFFRIVPDVHCCSWTLDLLTNTEFTLCYEELLKILLRNAVTCRVFSRIFNCEVLKTTVLFYSSTAEGLWRGQKVLSARCCVVQQWLHSGNIPHRPLSGNSLLRDSFRNLETRASSKFLMSFSCSASQN